MHLELSNELRKIHLLPRSRQRRFRKRKYTRTPKPSATRHGAPNRQHLQANRQH